MSSLRRGGDAVVAPVGRPIGELVVRYGGPVANGLLDPRCRAFFDADVEGVVGFREGPGSVVAVGDPVCAAADLPALAARFRRHCAARGRCTVWAAAGEALARAVCDAGGAAVEFGETLVFDPRRDPQSGKAGRELRKKVGRARRAGAAVHEYRPDRDGREPALERALDDVVARWLDGRRGLQVYVARVELFEPRFGRRWFYVRDGFAVVGVLALLRMEARGGWLLEHLLAAPGAPVGTAELLVAECFAALAADGCRFATFGPAPAPRLGAVENLGGASAAFARALYATVARLFHLDGRTRFQQKFQPASREPGFVAFDPPRVGPAAALGLFRAFNVSLR